MERKRRTAQSTDTGDAVPPRTRGRAEQPLPPRVRIRPDQVSIAKRDQAGVVPDKAKGPSPSSDANSRGTEGVYVISVAARLLEMHPQTLRKYERLGLVQPARTIGMLRLYSDEDLYQLRLIRHMEESLGLNLAGVEWLSLIHI